jgi:drug/metabolite transporter (DMT)-like permease
MITLPVVLMVLAAAAMHAGWNFLAKTIPGGAAFVWLVAVVMSILLAPGAILWLYWYGFEWTTLNVAVLLLTAVLHLVYFLVLQKGYAVADLSVVYPLARGTGPVFASLGAVWWMQEQISGLGGLGLLLILSGVLLISGIGRQQSDPERVKKGVFYGLLTGALIATYTVWDAYAVRTLGIAPILVEYTSHPVRVLALLPVAFRRGPEIRQIWRGHQYKIITIALVSPLAFILVLYAMKQAPVHFVAPARELSIVFGVLLGVRLLQESDRWPRIAGSLLILGGVICLMQ